MKINYDVDRNRIQKDIEILASFTDKNQSGFTRRAFSPCYYEGRNWLGNRMKELGLLVSNDAASNLIGTIVGSEPNLSKIILGSHTDTVAGGGRFDGIIGVLAGLEIASILKEKEITLRHTLEIVDFTAEEPTDFGISTVGSRGMVDALAEEMLAKKDYEGYTLKERLNQAGGDALNLSLFAKKKGDVAIYLELHIEQGPVLYETNNKLGIVTGIVGISRHRVIVKGDPNHAGTTPMNLRLDALTAASEMILSLERICNENYLENVVGTVGKLIVEPNASNVIPGSAIFEFEVRCVNTSILSAIISKYKTSIKAITKKRKIEVFIESISDSEAVQVDQSVIKIVENVCKVLGTSMLLPSGAGHDANHLAKIAPIAMIFIPSKEGKSHCSEEWTDYEDIALGVSAMLDCILEFDER